MALTSSEARFGGVSKTFHWLTALLILTLIPLGWYANQLPYETDAELTRKVWYFSTHKTLGVAAFFVALARILWALTQPRPALLNADRKLESFAAETVHWLLYAALVIVPLSGWIAHAAAAGFAPIRWPFGQGLPLVPKDVGVEHFFTSVHWVATKVLIAAILLHIAGALKHHLIDRDATLRRMLPGETNLPDLPPTHHDLKAPSAAVAVWTAAIALASVLATSDTKNAVEAADLDEISSEWQVQDGSIELTIVQFGNEVTGSFADWTAEISYDPDIDLGKTGEVTATISIPSLTLGSVTQQALGADFFDASTHPRAVFQADLQHGPDDHQAVGTLTIKDQSVPLTLPFILSVDGDKAGMRGQITLDRRSFGIGDNMPDPANLGFGVRVLVTLTAIRSSD